MTVLGATLCLGLLATGPATRPARQPTTRPGKGFTITGLLKPADRVKRVRLIDREDPANVPAKQKRVVTASFDRESGRFTATDLPSGYYDLMIDTTTGRIDGVNLRDAPDPFDLAPDTSEKPPLTKKNVAFFDKFVQGTKMFENRKRMLFAGGNRTRAKILVEKIRDQGTTYAAKKGHALWRIEVWEFRQAHGGWVRKKWVVLYRRWIPLPEFRKLNWMFDPALGGLAAQAGYTTDIGEYHIPATFDPAKGRTPE